MNKALILVVEDDRPIRNLIVTTLKTHDYKYLVAENGSSAILEASSHNPDIVLLDLGLPDIEGVEVIRKIRTWSNMPIIVISARSEDTDKILGLSMGADDYITKPFNILEVKARIKAILRRNAKYSQNEYLRILENGDLKLELDGRRLYVCGEEVNLTAKEFDLLELMVGNPNKVFSREELLNTVWGYEYPGDVRTVDVHIRTLRQKLGSAGELVETVRGVGYKINMK